MRSAAQLLRRVMAAAEEVDQTVHRGRLMMVEAREAAEAALQACSWGPPAKTIVELGSRCPRACVSECGAFEGERRESA